MAQRHEIYDDDGEYTHHMFLCIEAIIDKPSSRTKKSLGDEWCLVRIPFPNVGNKEVTETLDFKFKTMK